MPKKRTQRPRHPVDRGRRVTLTGSELERGEKAAALRTIERDFRLGIISAGEARLKVERLLGRTGARLTVGEVVERWLPTLPDRRRALYAQRYRLHLRDYFASRAVEDCDYDVCAAWHRERVGLKKPDGSLRYAWGTVRAAWAVLGAAVRWAKRKKLVADIPWEGFSVGGDPNDDGVFRRGYASDIRQVLAILRAALAHDQRQHARCGYSDLAARLAWLLLTGSRESEAAAAAWDAVHIDLPVGENWVSLRRAVKAGWRERHPRALVTPEQTKGRHADALRIPELLVQVLRGHREYLRRRGWYADAGPVFPASAGRWAGQMRADAARFVEVGRLRQVVAAAGLPGAERWTLHSCRHSFASLEIAGGANLREVASRLRVRSARVAMVYLHERGGEQMPPVFSPVDEALGLPAPKAPRLPAAGELQGELGDLAQGFVALQAAASVPRLPTGQSKGKAKRKGRLGYYDLACELGWEPGQQLPGQVRDDIRSAGERARQRARRQGESAQQAASAARKAREAQRRAWLSQVARARKGQGDEG